MTASTQCVSCRAQVRDRFLCARCLAGVERDLGDVAALTADVRRVFATDERVKGSDDEPLLRSRSRRRVPKVEGLACPLDPATLGPVLVPEPLAAGEFGRDPSTPWDADHGLGREIDATVARQTATNRREGGRGANRPLPFNDRASRVAHAVHATLGAWVRDLHTGDEPWPRVDTVAFAAWLLSRLDRVAAHPAADELERDVHAAVEKLRRAVDRPADRWWMGPCDTDDCLEDRLVGDGDTSRVVRRPTELYADPDASTVTCRNCGTVYAMDDRRAWLLAAAWDQLAHAELIGRAAPALGVEITPAAIRGYAARDRIVAKGVDRQGRPLYRVGDVVEVAQDVIAERERRREVAAEKADKAAKRSA